MAEETVDPAELDTGSGLFTDGATEGPQGMLSDYDGAEPGDGAAPAIEPTESKGGKKLLRLDLGNGSVYVAETEHELLEKVAAGKKAADAAIADRENQIRTLRAQPAPQAPANRQTPASTAPVPDGAYDDQTYLDLLGKDTIAARKYQDKFIYGDLDPVDTLRKSYAVAQANEHRNVAATFHQRNPDFPASVDAGNKVLSILEQNRLPVTVVNLEWAYNDARRRGEITPVAAEPIVDPNEYEDVVFGQAPSRQAPIAPVSRGRGAPPSPRSNGKPPEEDSQNPETMPLDRLKEILQKKGALTF